MYSEKVLARARSFKDQNAYRKMGDTSKTILNYLLAQVEDCSENQKFAVHKMSRSKRGGKATISLFELRLDFNALYVHTVHKAGSMQVKCFRPADASVLADIEKFCKFAGWKATPEGAATPNSKKMNVTYVLEEETP